VAQAAHAGEELLTGFHRVVPESLGLAPWPASFFVGFNAVWLVIWILAVAALRAGASTAALVPLWFLGLALAASGLAHPLLSLRAGGYVPGLLTSPVAGVVGIVLLARLTAATGRGPAAPGPTPAAVGRSPGG
jgi:hypothetical protein